MSLESDELEDRDIVGARKTLAVTMQSNLTNIILVMLIITYCLVTFIFTAIPDDKTNNDLNIKAIYHVTESIFITIFIIEVISSRYAFKQMYFSNKFNVINCVIIAIIVIFLIIDIAVDNYSVSILLRTRGVMRLFHAPIILENIKSRMKMQRSINYRDMKIKDTDDKPTAEKVIEILLELNE